MDASCKPYHDSPAVVRFQALHPLPHRPPKICSQPPASDPSSSHSLTTQALSLLPGRLTPSPSTAAAATAGAPNQRASEPHAAHAALLGQDKNSYAPSSIWGDAQAAVKGLAHRLSHTITAPTETSATSATTPTDPVTAANLAYIESFNRQQEQRYRGDEGTKGDERAKGAERTSVSAPRDGFKLGVGKWVRWSDEEWRAVALGRNPGHR